ncbi:gliding motility-associated C-terminal domain-containing protein, partial [bacterium]|nr:gliding motility-associated C-terminal domain-containing protein [bacterium]
GEKMWETEDMEASWDGTFNGAECSPDVYLYVVKAKNEQGKEFEFTGTVTLLR